MSIVYMNSCGDNYATAQIAKRFTTLTGGSTIVPGAGRREGSALNLSSHVIAVEQSIPGLATYAVGVAFKQSILNANDLITFKEGATEHVIIRVTSTGAVEVLRAPSTQLGISAAGLIFAGFWNYLEVLCTVDDAAGVVTVNLNSTQLLNLTSQDTNNAGAVPEIDAIKFQGAQTFGTFLDDIYIVDTTGAAPQNTLLGDTRVESLVPVADGALQDFPVLEPVTPTTHFDKVNDAEPDDAVTFVGSETGGHQDTYDMQTLPDPGGTSTIFGLQLLLWARKDKVTAKSFKPITRSGGTVYPGAINPLVTTFEYYTELWQQDPDTAADWTESGVNAAEFGAEVV